MLFTLTSKTEAPILMVIQVLLTLQLEVCYTYIDKARAVEVELPFIVATLNDAEKSIVMRAVAFKLSLPFDNVIEKKYDVVGRQPFTPASGKLPLIITPLYSNPNFPDMVTHAEYLNNVNTKNYIKSVMASYDTTPTLSIFKYTLYTPQFTDVEIR
jgi:hypothetical protein